MQIIKENTNFPKYEKVEVREASAADFEKAEKTSKQIDIANTTVLVSLCCKFDGEKLPPEEVQKMKASDFLELSLAVIGDDLKTLEK